jgi:hypothetical protein
MNGRSVYTQTCEVVGLLGRRAREAVNLPLPTRGVIISGAGCLDGGRSRPGTAAFHRFFPR